MVVPPPFRPPQDLTPQPGGNDQNGLIIVDGDGTWYQLLNNPPVLTDGAPGLGAPIFYGFAPTRDLFPNGWRHGPSQPGTRVGIWTGYGKAIAQGDSNRLFVVAYRDLIAQIQRIRDEATRQRRLAQAEANVLASIQSGRIKLPPVFEIRDDGSVATVARNRMEDVQKLLEDKDGLGSRIYSPNEGFLSSRYVNKATHQELADATKDEYVRLADQEEWANKPAKEKVAAATGDSAKLLENAKLGFTMHTPGKLPWQELASANTQAAEAAATKLDNLTVEGFAFAENRPCKLTGVMSEEELLLLSEKNGVEFRGRSLRPISLMGSSARGPQRSVLHSPRSTR